MRADCQDDGDVALCKGGSSGQALLRRSTLPRLSRSGLVYGTIRINGHEPRFGGRVWDAADFVFGDP
jgi:hypothetical protein